MGGTPYNGGSTLKHSTVGNTLIPRDTHCDNGQYLADHLLIITGIGLGSLLKYSVQCGRY